MKTNFADLSQTAIGAAISNDGGASWTNGQLSSVSWSMNAVTGNSVTWEGMAGIRLSGPFIAGWTDGRAGGYPTMYAGKFAP